MQVDIDSRELSLLIFITERVLPPYQSSRKDLQSKVPGWGFFIATVSVLRELLHCLGSGLMQWDLECCAVGSNVPEPAAGCTVSDGQSVAIVLVKTDHELLKVVAGIILKFQVNLEDASVPEGVQYICDVAGMACMTEIISYQMWHSA